MLLLLKEKNAPGKSFELMSFLMQPHDDRAERWQARYNEYAAMYYDGQMSSDMFRGALYRLGFRDHEIEAEINLWSPK